MSSKKKKTYIKDSIKKDEKISSVIEIKEKDNKLVYILIIIIAILLSLLIYFAFIKNCKEKNEDCIKPAVPVDIKPKYQLINYAGFKFKTPLDWDFVNDSNDYSISNSEETIFISFENLEVDYETFISNEYQINFLEKLQTSDNIKIINTSKENDYYAYEGDFNNYNYLIIALGNDKKTILVKTQFIDKVTYNKSKNDIIEFAISSINKSE